jgi:ribosomal-protein-alanine N-acetyltransferase
MSKFTVRRCEKADLLSVLAVEKSIYGEDCYNQYFFRQAHDLYPDLLLIAVNDEDVVVGYILGATVTDCAKSWILSLAIDNVYRRQGIASLLTDALLKVLVDKSPEVVLLTVEPTNTSAIKLYQGFGFGEVSREADYYGAGQERIVMEKAL